MCAQASNGSRTVMKGAANKLAGKAKSATKQAASKATQSAKKVAKKAPTSPPKGARKTVRHVLSRLDYRKILHRAFDASPSFFLDSQESFGLGSQGVKKHIYKISRSRPPHTWEARW